jgi:large subunit ribosomal protein L6
VNCYSKFGNYKNKNMSRLGKKPISIPEKTTVTVAEGIVTVVGPLGTMTLNFKPVVEISLENNTVVLKPLDEELETLALWGTYSSIIDNLIQGVNKNYEKRLIIEGVGYKAEVKGDSVHMNLGFSHPIIVKIPNDLKVVMEKDTMIITGIDKAKVGQFAADIRAYKKPEPYKGKGIRYSDEIVRRKEGKKTM